VRTTKAQSYLAAEEALVRDELAAVNAECKTLQAKLDYIVALRAKLSEAPKRARGKSRTGVTTTAPVPSDGTTTVA
jgi:hypothetical protein